MRTIASLLFGRDAGELLDLITGEDGITGSGPPWSVAGLPGT